MKRDHTHFNPNCRSHSKDSGFDDNRHKAFTGVVGSSIDGQMPRNYVQNGLIIALEMMNRNGKSTYDLAAFRIFFENTSVLICLEGEDARILDPPLMDGGRGRCVRIIILEEHIVLHWNRSWV